jgi:integrase
MGSLHRRKDTKYWWAAWYGPHGRQIYRSTKCTDRNDANKVLTTWEGLTNRAKAGVLTEDQVRRVAADLYLRATGDTMKRATVKEFLEGWAKRKELEVADASAGEYRRIASEFQDSIGKRAEKDCSLVTVDQVAKWRDTMAGRLAAGTVNKALKVLRGAWNQAAREGLVASNPFAAVRTLKAQRSFETTRRAFTLDEVRRILAVADGEWLGIILFGLYTGQRLSDITGLAWNQIDTAEGVVRFVTSKTGAVLDIPLAAPLMDWIGKAKVPKSPNAPIFPVADACTVSQNSKAFAKILVAAGLRKELPNHKATGKGRNSRREASEVTFHCLRHTATSLLKNAGVSDVVAREIIGHKTEAISRAYTHIESKTMKRAIDALPDVTKAGKAVRK